MHKLIECPICQHPVNGDLGKHVRSQHSEKDFKTAILKAKEKGMSDPEIGAVFGITFRQLEKIITEAYGVNISAIKKKKKIKYWAPQKFKEETTTVWSFKQRGDWATHDGKYRGNWSPYIPRNVILKYSKPGELVLDYFAGGGTTAVEAKLLGRKCMARDINPACVNLTLENLKFASPQPLFPSPVFEPDVAVGDAKNLAEFSDNSIDLICAHPPYAGIINYSSNVEGDLSQLGIEDFIKEVRTVATESYRVLKPGRKCAILIGDTRKKKHVIPIGFQTIDAFLEAGFKLKELVIKRQHNCKTTGFWYDKSIKYNFLLLAHEYLPIFEKPFIIETSSIREEISEYVKVVPNLENPASKKITKLETTTVWLFPADDFDTRFYGNVIERYSNEGKVLFAERSSNNNFSDLESYLKSIEELADSPNKFFIVHTQDIRKNKYVVPVAKNVINLLKSKNLKLKEIIIVAKDGENISSEVVEDNLTTAHQYLLVYEIVK